MDLRALAKNSPCLIRSHECNHDPSTTVLCHVRLIGISGLGLKSPDLLGAWGCSHCHDLVDGRAGRISKVERDLLLLQGMARTQAHLIKLLGEPWQ